MSFLQLMPQYRDYIWGGHRLRPTGELTAEAWVVYEADRVAAGPWAGRTLAEVAAAEGAALLGQRAVARTGTRFPLLIKLLDAQAWLSLQVHPNDAQAVRLAGPDQFGKTEAWHVLEAAPGAQLIAGVRPGVTAEALAAAIRSGTVLDCVQFHTISAGDTLLLRAGTIHALGPGVLLYEVQQTSDLTYRVFDWNRPATPQRPLHIEQSLAVIDPTIAVAPAPPPPLGDGERAILITGDYFTLALLVAATRPVALDTRSESFHALTVIEGEAELAAQDERISLRRFETVVVPAAAGAYRLLPHGPCRVLQAGVAV